MTALLDTNVLIRHFTADPPAQARRATAHLKAAPAEELTLLDLHVAECVYVLEGPYRQRRSDVGRLMGSVLGLQSVLLENEQAILRSLDLYVNGGFDFTDAYLVARAEAAGIGTIVGFDRFDAKLGRATRVRRVEP